MGRCKANSTAKTVAERQAQRRAKIAADPLLLAEMKGKERLRWHQRVRTGKVKLVTHLSDREKRLKRREWRHRWKDRAAKKKTADHDVLPHNDNTCTNLSTPSTSGLIVSCSRQHVSGRKKVRRDRSAAYRKIKLLEARLLRSQSVNNMLRKRLSRQQQMQPYESKRKLECESNTPRKTANLTMKSPRKTRRALVYHYSFLSDVRQRANHLKSHERRVAISVICAGKLLKKHRLLSALQRDTGLRIRNHGHQNTKLLNMNKQRFRIVHSKRSAVEAYFQRDDVSRPTAGKKETVTRGQVKKQKRFLLHPVSELHNRFCALYPDMKLSRSMFAWLKPFWVLRPRMQDRDTCLCQLHENARLLHEKLKQLKAIPQCTLEDVIRHTVCSRDVKKRQCMINECRLCRGRSLPFLNGMPLCEGAISWHQWQAVYEVFENRKVRKTVKKKLSGTAEQLKSCYAEQIKRLKPHVYTIVNQYEVLASKKEELQDNEVMIHIDFSENWTVKTLSAVQSAHFGASLKQISLHTGVAYFGGTRTPNMSFCSISDRKDHGPTAVWSHLLPVLINIRATDGHIDVLHVLSDGPTTQYRNRYNFFLASVIPSLLGFQRTFWNFSAAGHGKGPADGVGAAVKRLADRCVLSDKEVDNACSLWSSLKPLTDIRLFLIEDFISLSDTINIPTFPETMKIHQLMAEPTGRIMYRRWSCYCSQQTMCRCVAYMLAM